MLLTLLVFSVCFLSYANGANDNFKGVASLYGSGSTSYRAALTWATLATLTGSLCALYLAQTLLIKFTGKGLVSDVLVQSVPFIVSVAAGAGVTVIIATRIGFPISTTHALLGAMLGSGLIADLSAINLIALQKSFVFPLLLSPLAAILLANAIYGVCKFVLQWHKRNLDICFCIVDQTIVGADECLAISSRPTLLVDKLASCTNTAVGKLWVVDKKKVFDALHFFSAGSVCFARGLNDTPKIAALLLLFPYLNVSWVIAITAIAMAIGGIVNSRKVAETMSHHITKINHQEGLYANISTAILVIFASRMGMPVSTTHVSVGSLFGIGLANGQANFGMVGSIVLSWLLTLPCAALCAAVIYRFIVTAGGTS